MEDMTEKEKFYDRCMTICLTGVIVCVVLIILWEKVLWRNLTF